MTSPPWPPSPIALPPTGRGGNPHPPAPSPATPPALPGRGGEQPELRPASPPLPGGGSATGEGGQGGEVAFDALAATYDTSFTTTPLGTLLREAVWRRLDARFAPGDRVLELGCGTGEDAIHLAGRGVRVVATDASSEMVETARRKARANGLDGSIEVHHLPAEDLAAGEHLPGPFDGAFSDFGGLNCVADLGAVSRALAGRLRPCAPVLLCVMGPLVPWEWAWYLGRGDLKKAFRRLRPGGVAWRGLTVRYPSIPALRRAFDPDFRTLRTSAIGALLPPTYVEEWIRRHPRLLTGLARWERRLERMPPFPWLADHYLIEMERRA